MFSILRKDTASEIKILAIADGKLVAIDDVADETFSSKVLGDGLAFEPEGSQTVVAPAAGIITHASSTMPHAVGMRFTSGVEALIHVGIDTVDIRGQGFKMLVHQGQRVKAGQALIRFDKDQIIAAGHRATIMLVFTELAQHKELKIYSSPKTVVAGKTLVAEIM